MQNLDYEFIRWSIDARKSIQATILNLTQCADQPMHGEQYAARFTELTGVAFSLWRAAFLASLGTTPLINQQGPNSTDRSLAKVDHANDLLKTILASNSVSFADDRRTQSWMAEFYIDNASMRLMRYEGQYGLSERDAIVTRFREYSSGAQVPVGFIASARAWILIFACFNKMVDILVAEMGLEKLTNAEVLDAANYKFKPRPSTLENLFNGADADSGLSYRPEKGPLQT